MKKPKSTLEMAGTAFYELNKQVVEVQWDHHRNFISDLVSIGIEADSVKKSALILGAGNCNDFNLSQIVYHFASKTSLLDIDEKSVKRSIQRLDPKVQKLVRPVVKDLTGLFYDRKLFDYLNHLMKQELLAANEILRNWVEHKYRICPEYVIPGKHSFLMSANVSTQLIIPFQLMAYHADPMLFTNELSIMADIMARNHLKQIAKALVTGGRAIIVSEQYEWGNVGNPTHSIINSPEQLLEMHVQDSLEQVGLFIRGRISRFMVDEMSEFQVDAEATWLWNFSGERHYLVKGWVVRKID
ncbi:hypothetical protein PV433_10905 [Paenibacillus sp. GYB004]|uniref:hypothetical protein n=1 Tax=Paenibacillus sp. GYB004 TaxID=2994393 RepID=UPI002F96A582